MPNIFQRLTAAFRPPPVKAFSEMGTAGTPIYAGQPQTRELSPEWVGEQRYITISDMAVNASIVAAGVHYFANLIAHPQWTFVPADESAEAREVADFVEEVLTDMSQPWSRIVRRASMFRFFGFGVQEWTAKRRKDGRVGLASIEPRPAATIERWSTAPDGSVTGVWQRSPQDGQLLGIPRSKVLYLVDDVVSDSPEGVGIFRHLAQPWSRLKTYYQLETRAFERDLRGIPIGRVPYTLLNEAVEAGKLTAAKARDLAKSMEDFVKVAVTESDTGLTVDSSPYESQAADGLKVASVPQWGIELLQGSGIGLQELDRAITRTQFEMARIMACQHLLLGQDSGNRALSEDVSRGLYLVGNAVLGDITAGMRSDVVRPVCTLNNIPEELWPHCQAEDVSFKSAEGVARTLREMALAGATLSPDDPVVNDVRGLLGVADAPPPSPEMLGLPVDDDAAAAAGAPEEPDDDITEDDEGGGEPAGEEGVAKGARTLFVKRRLLNANAIRRWAAGQGIKTTLPPGDMHVTVAFSREPVDWSGIPPQDGTLVVEGGVRDVHQFPPRAAPNGALVLRFASGPLTRRWREFRNAGASWDFPEYQPHVTLTYGVAEADVRGIEPYSGPLLFGPEEYSEVNDNWASEISEVATGAVKRSVPRRRSRREVSM